MKMCPNYWHLVVVISIHNFDNDDDVGNNYEDVSKLLAPGRWDKYS